MTQTEPDVTPVIEPKSEPDVEPEPETETEPESKEERPPEPAHPVPIGPDDVVEDYGDEGFKVVHADGTYDTYHLHDGEQPPKQPSPE